MWSGPVIGLGWAVMVGAGASVSCACGTADEEGAAAVGRPCNGSPSATATPAAATSMTQERAGDDDHDLGLKSDLSPLAEL